MGQCTAWDFPPGAYSVGHENLRKPEIAAAIADREARIADELGLTKHHVFTRLSELLEVAMTPTPPTYQGDAIRIVDDDGSTRMLTEITAAWRSGRSSC